MKNDDTPSQSSHDQDSGQQSIRELYRLQEQRSSAQATGKDRDNQPNKQTVNHMYGQRRRRTLQKQSYILWPFIVIIPIIAIGFITRLSGNDEDMKIRESSLTSISEDESEEETVTANFLSSVFSLMPHSLPSSIKNKILAKPLSFIKDIKRVLNNTTEDLLVLVDKQTPLSSEYIPQDLQELDDYANIFTLNKKSLLLSQAVIPPLEQMVQDALDEQIVLPISSTYRSYRYQAQLFARYTQELGEKEAARQSARPGTSQHQLGTTIDFGSITPAFAHTDAGKWLATHAWKYGFSLSYPQNQESITGYIYESWHYRYIGVPATFFSHLYFDDHQQYTLEFIKIFTEINTSIQAYQDDEPK